jgi:hypothetical protein
LGGSITKPAFAEIVAKVAGQLLHGAEPSDAANGGCRDGGEPHAPIVVGHRALHSPIREYAQKQSLFQPSDA